MKVISGFIALALACSAHAEPLSVRDMNPLLSGYELPPALPSVQPRQSALAGEFAIANISLNQRNAQNFVRLDGEITRWQFSFIEPINEQLSLRLEVPYVNVSGGHLDNFIESFHHIFGLPNGNRALWPRNRLLIEHGSGGVDDYLRTDTAAGLGDITLRMGWQLNMTEKFNNAVWLSLKLPTGAADKLLGSGATDVALSFASSQQLSARWLTQQQVSLSILGKGERLAAQQQTVVWSGSAGVAAAFNPRWSLALQFDAHSQVVDTGLRGLGNALQFSFGPRYRLGAWQTNLLLSEDIAVDTAPDIQFQLDVARRF